VVRLRRATQRQRDLVMRELKKKGINTNDYFRPIHLQPFYRQLFGYKKGNFTVTEKAAGQTIALPFFNTLSEKQIKYVCDHLKAIMARVVS
jgi:perosamine synthetase